MVTRKADKAILVQHDSDLCTLYIGMSYLTSLGHAKLYSNT